jgi:hypothetical protein
MASYLEDRLSSDRARSRAFWSSRAQEDSVLPALDPSEAQGHRAGDDNTRHLDVAVHDDLLYVVAEIGHGSQRALPDGLLRLDARRGQAKGRVDDSVGVKQTVEGVEVSGITGSQPPKDNRFARIGHIRVSRWRPRDHPCKCRWRARGTRRSGRRSEYRSVGHDVGIVLAGDAAELVNFELREHLEGVGLPPVRELFAKTRQHAIPLYV